jgi:hypothetical protein
MKFKNASITKGARSKERCNFRGVATHHAFHALGIEAGLAPEKRRLLELAVNEAEALACETGVPELVLLTLAEEKVRATKRWLARQKEVKQRSSEFRLEFAE